MLEDFSLEQIVDPLITWYEKNKRELPWRENITSYRVWVSEIMLQQTRVEAVKPYYARFMKALPQLKDLADCEEEALLKLWEGLGYYNRVRNLQTAAKDVMENYEGELPADYHELLKLKGIGNYTAGAIASIAYKIPVPAVDGNVLRVIQRVCADDSDIMKQSVRTKIEQALQKVIPANQPAEFNQGLMELGATVCVPNGEPNCEQCPWNAFCQARIKGIWLDLPVKTKPKARKKEKRTILIIRDGKKMILQKRENKGLLAGLYEFPNILGHLDEEEALNWTKQRNLSPIHIQKLEDSKHIFSHIEWHMIGFVIRVDELAVKVPELLFADIAEIKENYAVPSAFAAYMKYISEISH